MNAPTRLPCCPTCGAAVDGERLLFDLTGNMAARLGMRAKLTPIEAELLQILSARPMHPASTGELLAGLYGQGREPETGPQVIRVHMYGLRRKLQPLGMRIRHAWGRGYSLVAA